MTDKNSADGLSRTQLALEVLSKLFKVSWRENEIHLDFISPLFSQTDFLCKHLPLGLGATVMLELHVHVEGHV